MAFLRLTRRGYENTFLLHAFDPGARPTVLYWYRSAPGVRVGRPALDEDAIRTIEEQHPEIDFDWPHILEVGAIIEPEVERRHERATRRPAPPPKPSPAPPARLSARPTVSDEDVSAPPGEGEGLIESVREAEAALAESDAMLVAEVAGVDEDESFEEQMEDEIDVPARRGHDLLEELVGHEIATRLHARYAEIISRVHRVPEAHPQRPAWQARAEALNPDNWVTPDEVLRGVSHADALFDALRQELLSH